MAEGTLLEGDIGSIVSNRSSAKIGMAMSRVPGRATARSVWKLQREEKKATIATMLDTAEGKKGDGSAKMAAIGKKQRWDRW
ncbi:hypothetical protein GW17_00058418 [Ensete ventricosum]|nr:hypothetical protein GW17_00058418 [Ensete ventricosum]